MNFQLDTRKLVGYTWTSCDFSFISNLPQKEKEKRKQVLKPAKYPLNSKNSQDRYTQIVLLKMLTEIELKGCKRQPLLLPMQNSELTVTSLSSLFFFFFFETNPAGLDMQKIFIT